MCQCARCEIKKDEIEAEDTGKWYCLKSGVVTMKELDCEECLGEGKLCGICGMAVSICSELYHETSPIDCPKCKLVDLWG